MAKYAGERWCSAACLSLLDLLCLPMVVENVCKLHKTILMSPIFSISDSSWLPINNTMLCDDLEKVGEEEENEGILSVACYLLSPL